jgi:hypothetical protein
MGMVENPFKTCPCCNASWRTRTEFLTDEALTINGYAPDFDNLLDGLLLFTHQVKSCCSTMGLKAKHFADLHDGPTYGHRKTGDDDCPGYCFHEQELRRCDAKCDGAAIREMIEIIRTHPKRTGPGSAPTP